MKIVEYILSKEKLQLERITQQARKRLQTAPKGHLRIAQKQNRVEYYYRNEATENANGRYMKKNEMKLIKGIAQRDYDTQIVKNADERIRAISDFLKKYQRTSLEKVNENTTSHRRELISEYIVSDKEYAEQWENVVYEGKMFSDNTPEIFTERGERVRSKSEKIIADKLFAMGVPYRYEYPLTIQGNIKVFPDFTILKMPEREEVYLEHFGMMDDNDYVSNMLYKLGSYEKNGIYLGVNLFMTHETAKEPLNTRTLDCLIREVFAGKSMVKKKQKP